MAEVRAYAPLNLVERDVFAGDVIEASDTEIVISNGIVTANYLGFGFEYIGSSVVDGVLTGYEEDDIDGLRVEAFDFAIPADVAYDYIRFDDLPGLFELVLDGADDIFGSGFSDVLDGYAGDDDIFGNDGNDELYGGRGDDNLTGGDGSNLIDGEDGFDIAFYDGSINDYTVEADGDRILVDSFDASDDLFSIERIAFGNATLAFDLLAEQGYRLYQAAFDRQPDQGGLSFWVDELDNGTSVYEAARLFMGSREFGLLYGQAPTDAELVNLLYQNVLNRNADEAGYDYWLDQMDSGTSRQEVLVSFSESIENQRNVADDIRDGIRLDFDILG